MYVYSAIAYKKHVTNNLKWTLSNVISEYTCSNGCVTYVCEIYFRQ